MKIHAGALERAGLLVLFCLGCCAMAAPAVAAEEEHKDQKDEKDQIVTDRPDFVESSLTVGKHRFQIETSVAGERNNDGTVHDRTLSTPTLLRFGIADNWEIRLETDGYQRVRTEDTSTASVATTYGMSDVSLGLKWHTMDGEGARPSMAWLLHADMPSGSESLRGHAVRPSLRAVMEWELPHESSLGIMPGVIYDSRDDGHRYTAGIFGVTVATTGPRNCARSSRSPCRRSRGPPTAATR